MCSLYLVMQLSKFLSSLGKTTHAKVHTCKSENSGDAILSQSQEDNICESEGSVCFVTCKVISSGAWTSTTLQVSDV